MFPWENLPSEEDRSHNSGPQQTQDCLRQTRTVTGRARRLAIVGDSRGRAIYANMLNVTDPMQPVWQRPENITGEVNAVNFTLFSPGLEPQTFCSKGLCSSNATNEFVEFQYHWRPFADRHLVETLQTLAVECATERRKCPDMVLLNNGIWYSGRVPYMFQFHQCEQFTMFRRGLQRLVPPLIQLARRTLTVWKLEEAMLFEFVRDKHEPELTKTEYMALVVIQQALVYEMSLQVPELVIWSSLLPEVTRHMFHVCARAPPDGWPECPDPVHMGKYLQDSFCSTLLRALCVRARTKRR
ncbi:uncharacterized protein LOC122374937 [Amphibalanus amphitrite]|uniref:uncharacterized protein LOC122374937 n=1 Tax=Amphibalanus amphitrite TaxID=1232801 RepID=UPI001C927AFE|nr:uncharacterized protein LOC122374937 [Amphibalanus amphitrite]